LFLLLKCTSKHENHIINLPWPNDPCSIKAIVIITQSFKKSTAMGNPESEGIVFLPQNPITNKKAAS